MFTSCWRWLYETIHQFFYKSIHPQFTYPWSEFGSFNFYFLVLFSSVVFVWCLCLLVCKAPSLKSGRGPRTALVGAYADSRLTGFSCNTAHVKIHTYKYIICTIIYKWYRTAQILTADNEIQMAIGCIQFFSKRIINAKSHLICITFYFHMYWRIFTLKSMNLS